MTIETLQHIVKGRLSPKRFAHTLGVVDMAKRLAKHYGAPVGQAEMAALLHDAMKERPLQEMQSLVREAQIPVDSEMLKNGALLHGSAGAAYAKLTLHIQDEAICEAIRVHSIMQ